MIPITSTRNHQKLFLWTAETGRHVGFCSPQSPGLVFLQSQLRLFEERQKVLLTKSSAPLSQNIAGGERVSRPQLLRRSTRPKHSLAQHPQAKRALEALRYREARARPASVSVPAKDRRPRAGPAAGRSRGPRGPAVPAGAGGGRVAVTPGTQSGREGGLGGEASGSAKSVGRGFPQTFFPGLLRDHRCRGFGFHDLRSG